MRTKPSRVYNRGFILSGTEVITEDLRVGIVDRYDSEDVVVVRFHSPPWPFAEFERYKRCQLTIPDVLYGIEPAPF